MAYSHELSRKKFPLFDLAWYLAFMENQITAALIRIDNLPSFLQDRAKNFTFGRIVPFLSTTGIKFHKTDRKEWTVSTKNNRKIQNHLKQVHACVMITLAETVAVWITAMNLPSDKIPLVKRIEADFVKRSQGAMQATVKLTDADLEMLAKTEKGELRMEVEVTDESGNAPILVVVTSAWVPKKR